MDRPSDWDIARALVTPIGSDSCRHARFQEFVIYADGEPVEKGARCMGCGLLVNRTCGALDPMGKGACDLPADPPHEIHRMQIRKGEWYSRCWMPGPDYADGWIEGEICWRDSPERREPWPG